MNRTSRRNSVALVVLALLALIGLKVSSGMSSAGLIWGPNLPRPVEGLAAVAWWSSLLILVGALIVGISLLVGATRTRNRPSVGSRRGGV